MCLRFFHADSPLSGLPFGLTVVALPPNLVGRGVSQVAHARNLRDESSGLRFAVMDLGAECPGGLCCRIGGRHPMDLGRGCVSRLCALGKKEDVGEG